MLDTMPESKKNLFVPLYVRFARIALGPLADVPDDIRKELISTLVQGPLTLSLASVAMLLTCAVAIDVTDSLWAKTWLALVVLFIVWRFVLVFWSHHIERRRKLAMVIAITMVQFGLFGVCGALCIGTGDRVLSLLAAGSALGFIAGLASRWAALPRLTLLTMALVSAPPIAALLLAGGMTTFAGLQMLLVTVAVGTLTLQNHTTLVRMMRSEFLNRQLAKKDPLTGLSNRSHLSDTLASICQSLNGGERRAFALLYLDLDGFKAINDAHGHEAGDQLLCEVGRELRMLVRDEDAIARIGGDEFILVLDGADEHEAVSVARRIIQRVARDYEFSAGTPTHIGCSVGIALAPGHGHEPALLVSRADMALYSVKRRGKGTYAVWGSAEEPVQPL
jgi:diguanylate cyclase (GGDEF)-like protein